MTDAGTIVVVEDLPQSPARVWRALTDPDRMARWLMPNDFVARVGHEFTFHAVPIPGVGFSGKVAARVLDLVAERRLVLSWKDAAGGPAEWTVTFTLEPSGTGTRLTLVHHGFDPGDTGQQNSRKIMHRGWEAALERLLAMTAEDDR